MIEIVAEDLSIHIEISDCNFLGRGILNITIWQLHIYKNEFFSPPPEDWYDKDGIIDTILHQFAVP